jgi:hypothetical protein
MVVAYHLIWTAYGHWLPNDLRGSMSHELRCAKFAPGWTVYLESREDIARTIRYVEDNPVKIGGSMQRWPFVTQYDGWLPGQVRIAKPQARRKPL